MNILIADIPETTPSLKIIHASKIDSRNWELVDLPSKAEFETLEEQGPLAAAPSKALKEICWRMAKACLAGDGIGLAAPQIGIKQRLFLIRFSETCFRAFLNPRYTVDTTQSGTYEKEGCLSVPGITLDILRAQSIRAEWFEYSDDGLLVFKSETLTGQLARIFQHEHDHLDGKSIVDRSGLSRADRRNILKKTR